MKKHLSKIFGAIIVLAGIVTSIDLTPVINSIPEKYRRWIMIICTISAWLLNSPISKNIQKDLNEMNVKTMNSPKIHEVVLSMISRFSMPECTENLSELFSLINDAPPTDQIKNSTITIPKNYGQPNNTFILSISGNNLPVSVEGASLTFYNISGHIDENDTSITFKFPDCANSPRGKYSFWNIRLKSITLSKTQVIISLDKGDVTINHA